MLFRSIIAPAVPPGRLHRPHQFVRVEDVEMMTLFASDSNGRVLCLTGVVQSIQFDAARPVGMRWRVEMDLLTVGSSGVR